VLCGRGLLLLLLVLLPGLGQVIDPELSAERGFFAIINALLAPVAVAAKRRWKNQQGCRQIS
jgi:hypothetical protein